VTAQPAEPAEFRPRRRPNLAEEVAAHIREGILAGRLKPGQRIDQDAVADELIPDHRGKRRTVGVDGCEAAKSWSVQELSDPRIANS